MMKKYILILNFINILFASILNVPHDYPTIQAGIDASVNNDTIYVSPNTYYENIDLTGKSISLIGEDKTTTIINGQQLGSVVTFQSDENEMCTLNSFTIINGKNTYGGGILLNNASPTIINININNNISEGGGGGGICCIDSSPILNKVDIFNNNSDDVGGGIYAKGISNPIVTNSAIYGNYASGAGGGIFVRDASQPYFNHTTIILNETDTWGGGIAGKYGAKVIVVNSILRTNIPEQIAMSQYDDNTNILVSSFNNIQNSLDSIQTGNNDNIFWLDNNIDQDPLFNDDVIIYAIDSSSPCVDSGIQDSVLLYNNDQETLNIPSYAFDGLNPDIGAYEFICEFPAFYDDCNICSSGNTNHEPNSDIDECGICFGNNEVMDCSGICFGNSYYDDCDICDDIIENDNDCITTVIIEDGFIESGNMGSIQVILDNSIGVSGFQFQIEDSPDILRNINVLSTPRTDSFSIFFNEIGSTLYIAAFHENLDVISPGSGSILELIYQSDVVAEEQDINLNLSNVILSNNNAEPIFSQEIDGIISILIDILIGDINNDEIINILDAVLLVDLIINEEDYLSNADLNSDNIINVIDIVILISLILEN